MSKNTNVYTTISGIDIPIKPISPTKLRKIEIGITNAFRKKGEPIDPPTYEVEVAGGGMEEHELDETSIESGNPEETARRQKNWDEHQDALKRMRAEQYEVNSRVVMEAIDYPLPKDESWIEKQKRDYIEVPDDPEERWIHWLETEVLITQDVVAIISDILELSSKGLVPDEDVQAAKEMFQRAVYSQPDEPEIEGDAVGTDAEAEGQMGAQPEDD